MASTSATPPATSTAAACPGSTDSLRGGCKKFVITLTADGAAAGMSSAGVWESWLPERRAGGEGGLVERAAWAGAPPTAAGTEGSTGCGSGARPRHAAAPRSGGARDSGGAVRRKASEARSRSAAKARPPKSSRQASWQGAVM